MFPENDLVICELFFIWLQNLIRSADVTLNYLICIKSPPKNGGKPMLVKENFLSLKTRRQTRRYSDDCKDAYGAFRDIIQIDFK